MWQMFCPSRLARLETCFRWENDHEESRGDLVGEVYPTTVAEYNAKYCVKGKGELRKRKPHVANEVDRFWNRMSEDEQVQWARSYQDFLVYFEIHRKK